MTDDALYMRPVGAPYDVTHLQPVSGVLKPWILYPGRGAVNSPIVGTKIKCTNGCHVATITKQVDQLGSLEWPELAMQEGHENFYGMLPPVKCKCGGIIAAFTKDQIEGTNDV